MPGVSLDIWDQPEPDNNPAKGLRADPHMRPAAGPPHQAARGPSQATAAPQQFPDWNESAASIKQQQLQSQYAQYSQQRAFEERASVPAVGPSREPQRTRDTGNPFAVNYQTTGPAPQHPAVRAHHPAVREQYQGSSAMTDSLFDCPRTIQLPGWINILLVFCASLLAIIAIQLFQLIQVLLSRN